MFHGDMSTDRLTSLGGLLVIVAAIGVLGFVLSGCSGQERAAPVDPPRAREALKTALERWKAGGRPEELQNGSPAITVQDFDWQGGQGLASFEVLGEGQYDDANLRIPVRLALQKPGGKTVTKQVKYVVGTSPVITVFRDFF